MVYTDGMPLPRFDRLPSQKQSELLDKAAQVLANSGVVDVGYNTLLANMGLPKASAYTYFDGFEDLYQAVISKVANQVGNQLGVWQPVKEAKEIWQQLTAGFYRVINYLDQNPAAAAITRKALLPAQLTQVRDWVEAALDNALAIGLANSAIPRDLLLAASLATLGALDTWAIEQEQITGELPSIDIAWQLLAQLWGVTNYQLVQD